MFDPTSRYYNLATVTMTKPDGRMVSYKRRRFLPKGGTLALLAEVMPQPAERLDSLAARTLGDSLAFWRICDANDAMDPLELVSEPRRVLRVPVPQL